MAASQVPSTQDLLFFPVSATQDPQDAQKENEEDDFLFFGFSRDSPDKYVPDDQAKVSLDNPVQDVQSKVSLDNPAKDVQVKETLANP